MRPVRTVRGFSPAADGSVLFELGDTRIICAASVSAAVPEHAEKRGWGWVTAEYSLLPYSTSPRTERRALRPDGRSVEIQRLIGRALRSVVDLARLKGYSITVDCDVLQADGGTRTASITGGFMALRAAVDSLMAKKALTEDPIISGVAAVSVGYVDGALLLDLDYGEDSRASVDMNIVMDARMNFVEIQGTGERSTFTGDQLDRMLGLARKGIRGLFAVQDAK
jgi:ribonuclease PH